MPRELALRDVHEDVGDLEDVIEVRLDAVAELLDFVLVACDLPSEQSDTAPDRVVASDGGLGTNLKALPALLETDDGDVCEPAAREDQTS